MPIERPQSWPSAMGHLGASIPALNTAIVVRASLDVLTCRENPAGSNTSPRIDAYNRRAGAPLGSYWCASWATACYVDAGADVPPSARASCDVLAEWAMANDLWRPKGTRPLPGWMVLYTSGKTLPAGRILPHGRPAKPGQLDAYHVGIVAMVDPYLASLEGNAAFSGFSVNGEAVLAKMVALEKVYGYLLPRLRTAA